MIDPRLSEAAQLLAERSGVTVPLYRRPLLAGELERLGDGDLDRGLAVFRGDDLAMVETIASVFAVGETYLFRGPNHFRELHRLACRSATCSSSFNVLCAGVSTGEEAWSAAMVLAAVYEPAGLPYHVLGWDLSRERLQRAQLGRFGRWSARTGFMGYDRYLIEVEGGYEIAPELRRHVQFERVNLVGALPDSVRRFDVIFFRNVSMYWRPQQASEVAAALGQRLAPGGSLLVGPGDPIELPSEDWSSEFMGSSIIYRRDATRLAPASAPRPRARPPAARTPAARTPAARIPAATAARLSPPASSPSETAPQPRRRPPPPARASPASTEVEDDLVERVRGLADRGDHEQALKLLEGRGSSSPELHEVEGIIHLSRGDHDAAIECFRAAAYWDPSMSTYTRWLELAIAGRESRGLQANS